MSLSAENWGWVLVFATIEILLCVFLGLGVGKNWWGQLLKAVAVSVFVAQLWKSCAAVVDVVLFLSCLCCFLVLARVHAVLQQSLHLCLLPGMCRMKHKQGM